MTKRLVHSFTLILVAAASVYAETPITAQIPFPFHVGNSILPSGSYTVDTNAAPGVLRLKSAEGKAAAMVVSYGVSAPAGTAQPKLVFTKYGDEYFLFQVWQLGDRGRELRKSRREMELASLAHRNLQTVLASR